MKETRMKRGLVVSVILLFIGVAVAPSINQSVVKASQDDDLVEITTQACGIKGYGNTTVKLTREQYQNLEQYLVEFRARLNQTSTKEEAVPILKEAVVELDKYGLLPRGMSVEQVQKLIISKNQNHKTFEGFFLKKNSLILEEDENRFCLMVGMTNQTAFGGPIQYFLMNLLSITFALNLGWVSLITAIIVIINFWISNLRPISFGDVIAFGRNNTSISEIPPFFVYRIYPADGWITTIGTDGKKEWNGSFFGQIAKQPIINFADSYCPGVIGFSGIKIINLNTGQNLYLGSALTVKIGQDYPFDS